MVQFSKLRLHGFKSFVDKTEFEIGQGLTGIVGPNGCGKSNLVEALRWSMGENSSKRMRGGTGSMEDVIFNGTEKRPARGAAEVSILLDNSKRTAPAAWNDSDEIEVIRRIERDHGSSYKINGKNVRARDVQILYADLTCGAGSPFLISQGKATALIQNKPLERRQVLEEAAGITGLYARRHEAELRLRATDNNLKRVEDIIGGMQTRLNDLKKQGRQATKYRNLSGQIRQLEVMIASLEWRRAHEKLQEVERLLGETETAVAERLTVVSQLNLTHNTQAEDLPGLRMQDAEMGAALQAQKLALQRLEDEAQRLSDQLDEAKAQLAQLYSDRGHEDQSLTENTAVLEKIDREEKAILATRDNEDRDLQEREAVRKAQQDKVNALEETHEALVEQNTTDRARRQAIEQQIARDQQRQNALQQRLESVKSQLAEKNRNQDSSDTEALRVEATALEEKAEALRAEVAQLETALEDSRQIRENARTALQEKEKEKSKLEAEISTLESVVKVYADEGFRAVFEDVHADEGFELALSRALGDTLMASLEDGAPILWKKTHVDLPSLPYGITSLVPYVKAPEELRAALSQIGVVATEEEGKRLSVGLKAGQALVSKDGAYWRWDGLQMRVTASDRHAVQLKQKNRLAELQKILPGIEDALAQQQQSANDIEADYATAQASLSEAQQELKTADAAVREKHDTLNRTIEAQAGLQAELAKLEESIMLAEVDLKALDEVLTASAEALEAFGDSIFAGQQEKIDSSREVLNEAREELHAAISDYELRKQEFSRRAARLQAIGDERVNLQNRSIRARERLQELAEREEQLTVRIEDLKKRPIAIREASAELLSKITVAEQERAVISDKLAVLEAELAETTKALKEAEAALGEAREARVHAQATAAERQTQLESIRLFIQEQFTMNPEELSAQAALSEEALDLDVMKQQKEKAVRDRDLIGPVNLRADIEAEELEQQLTGIINEKNDLAQAIEELRMGIEKLNVEARERLNIAFEKVNAHFRDLFTRLFGGGRAHLALIEADDPLEAGLEIFAQPPGKALQSLSLLSGGEQSLTAIALIFAIFLTNPAPICVLDEVDAPLDDANVDRFCTLLEEFADRGETRFLLITHHRMTMARMDRLYGVTMSEKGVSQLVSVDMNQQMDFLEAA